MLMRHEVAQQDLRCDAVSPEPMRYTTVPTKWENDTGSWMMVRCRAPNCSHHFQGL